MFVESPTSRKTGTSFWKHLLNTHVNSCECMRVCVCVCAQIMCLPSSCYLLISSRFWCLGPNKREFSKLVARGMWLHLWHVASGTFIFTYTDSDRKTWETALCQSGEITMKVVTLDKAKRVCQVLTVCLNQSDLSIYLCIFRFQLYLIVDGRNKKEKTVRKIWNQM